MRRSGIRGVRRTCEKGGGSATRLVVGYLATPGGADALALGVRLARRLGAELDACIMLPFDRALPAMVPTGEHDDLLASQAEKWLAAAMASVPADVSAHSHIVFTDSAADGLEHAVRFSSAAGTPLRNRALEHATQTLEAAKSFLPAGIPVTRWRCCYSARRPPRCCVSCTCRWW